MEEHAAPRVGAAAQDPPGKVRDRVDDRAREEDDADEAVPLVDPLQGHVLGGRGVAQPACRDGRAGSAVEDGTQKRRCCVCERRTSG